MDKLIRGVETGGGGGSLGHVAPSHVHSASIEIMFNVNRIDRGEIVPPKCNRNSC